MIKVTLLAEPKLTTFKLPSGKVVSSFSKLLSSIPDAELDIYLRHFSLTFLVVCPETTFYNFREQLPLLRSQVIEKEDGFCSTIVSALMYEWRSTFLVAPDLGLDVHHVLNGIFELLKNYAFIYRGHSVKRTKGLFYLD